MDFDMSGNFRIFMNVLSWTMCYGVVSHEKAINDSPVYKNRKEYVCIGERRVRK